MSFYEFLDLAAEILVVFCKNDTGKVSPYGVPPQNAEPVTARVGVESGGQGRGKSFYCARK